MTTRRIDARVYCQTSGLFAALALLLSACSFIPCSQTGSATKADAGSETPPETSSDSKVDSRAPIQLEPGLQHWQIRADGSRVRILVRRGGRLARLGHNHVLEVAGLVGEIGLSESIVQGQAGQYRMRLRFALADMQLDRPESRREEGGEFAKPLSESAIRATRSNMLGAAVLDAMHYPEVELLASGEAKINTVNTLSVRIRLHGEDRRVEVPVQLDLVDGRLRASGRFTIRQSDFGITPFSVMFGALQVKDTLEIAFSIAMEQARPGSTVG